MDRIYFNYTQKELDQQDAERQAYLAKQTPIFEQNRKDVISWSNRELTGVLGIGLSLICIGLDAFLLKIPILLLLFLATFVINSIYMIYCDKKLGKLLGPL
jgi:hypothetical protein